MKRWGSMAIAAAGALGLLAPMVGRADVPGYKFTTPVCAKGPYAGFTLFQGGDLNNKDQFTFNMVYSGGDGGERIHAWDGAKVIQISGNNQKLPDGATWDTGNVWTPHGINDLGHVVFTGDVNDGTGKHYILEYDLASGKYTILARPGDPAPGGGVYGDGGAGPSGRSDVAINNVDQVVFTVGAPGSDGDMHGSIFLYDPVTKKTTAIVRQGTAAPGGKTFDHAWWPDINDAGVITFSAKLSDDDRYDVYMWDKGTITAIAAPGTKNSGVTIEQSSFARIAKNGDIAFVAAVGEGNEPLGEGTTDNTAVFLYTAADKKLQALVKPGDKLPDGTEWKGVEPRRRPVGLNSHGQVLFVGIHADDTGGLYLWQGGKIQRIAALGDTLTGAGKVTGIARSTQDAAGNTWDGYNIAINENGDLLFPAEIDGTGCFVVGLAPQQPAPTAGN